MVLFGFFSILDSPSHQLSSLGGYENFDSVSKLFFCLLWFDDGRVIILRMLTAKAKKIVLCRASSNAMATTHVQVCGSGCLIEEAVCAGVSLD